MAASPGRTNVRGRRAAVEAAALELGAQRPRFGLAGDGAGAELKEDALVATHVDAGDARAELREQIGVLAVEFVPDASGA